MSGLPSSPERDTRVTVRAQDGSWRDRFRHIVDAIERHPALVFWLLALLISLPLVFNPGYFSHDELQWLALADREHWNELPWQGWFDFRPFQFRPLTFNTWLVLSRFIGYQPPLMHALVVGLGLLNAWLLRACMIGGGVRITIASGAALLFLLSPSVMQVHGWVGTIGDLYCLMAALLGVRVLQRHRGRSMQITFVVALTILALWSKESALVFPVLLLAAWPQRRWSLWLPVTASFAIVMIYLALRWQTILYTPRSDGHYAWSLMNIPSRLLDYAAFPFVPNLSETHVIRLHASAWRWVLGLGLCGGLLLLVLRTGWRALLVLVIGWIACLGPILLLGQSTSVYAYLASAWAFAACAAAWQASSVLPRRLMLGIAAVVSLHGLLIGERIFEIGVLQHGVFASIEASLATTTDAAPLRLAAAQRRDQAALVRMFHDVPSWRRIALDGRVVIVATDDSPKFMVAPDGSLHMPGADADHRPQ